MKGKIFKETLRRSWKGMIYLGISLSLMGLYIVLLIPDSKMLKQYGELMNSFSWLVKGLAGGDATFLATPAGFLNYGVFSWTILITAGYAVFVGLAVTANEEDRGIMDVLLSMPVPRWQVIVEKLLAYIVVIVVAIVIGFIPTWLTVASSEMFRTDVTFMRLVESHLNMLPLTLVTLCATVFLGTVIQRRSLAATLAIVFLIASFFIDMVARMAEGTDGLRLISMFNYYDSVHVMQNGLIWGNFAGLMAAALILAAGSLWFFQRRDVGV